MHYSDIRACLCKQACVYVCSMHVSVFACMCEYVKMAMYACMCVYACVCLCMHQCTCVCVHACIQVRLYECMPMDVSLYVCVCVCMCVSMYASKEGTR